MIKRVIPYGRQNITAEDVEAVSAVLRSDFLTQGPVIKEFEEAFAGYVGSKYAVAVANGTAALHLSVLALGLKTGDRVLTTPITFSASANCVRYCGAEVDFVDIVPESYLIDINAVRARLLNSPAGSYKGVIPVDFAGRAVNLEALRQLADEFGLWILEDACHAPGGFFVDSSGVKQFCGNGRFAELAIFSFHPVKHIACGEGGMITTNDARLYEKLLLLRTHGIVREPEKFLNTVSFASAGELTPNYPAWYMEMQELGYNYRLTDMQAALGVSQLKRAAIALERRRSIAAAYDEAFKNEPFLKGSSGLVEGHAYHLYVVEIENRLGLFDFLRSKGIFAQVHYIPVHLMPYYRTRGWKEGDLPNAEGYYSTCLSLPMYPSLSDDEVLFVVQQIKAFYHG